MDEEHSRPAAPSPPLHIITGLSGAGKSTAMRVFEDLGYYCVDNLPPALIPDFYTLYSQSGAPGPGVVIASDVRSGALFDDLVETVRALEHSGVQFTVHYLDCATHILINRYKEVRRSHPLQTGRAVEQAVEEERRRLEPIREIANRIIDTSDLGPAGLREVIVRAAIGEDTGKAVRLEFLSFGFKYGVPRDADFVFDVRFLPNPHYVPELRTQTGRDEPVYQHVMSSGQADTYFSKIAELVELTLEPFVNVGKMSLTVALGCTGGRHRSVAFARRLADHFASRNTPAQAMHRDVDKPLS